MNDEIKYHAIVAEGGVICGFYTSDVCPMPPDDAIEITYEQWRQFLDGQASDPCIIHRLINGVMVPFKPEPPPMTVPMSYAAAITLGLAVSSASGIIPPTTISLAMQQLANLERVASYVTRLGRFPGGGDSLPLVATDGTSVDVPSITAWQEIANAAADFVARCDIALKAGMDHGTWAQPDNTVTIT